MLGRALLCLSIFHFYGITAQGQCTDLRGQLINHGMHYVPGPDTCTLCICDNGLPKVCKAVLCSPPQDCRSFRVGNTCCEFICLDDVVKPAEAAEANVRLAAGGAAAVVLLTVALVVYRVRKQKRRRPPHADDQRSLTSIGYISGSMGYMGGTCETALAAWKPPGNYLPRGEAPPPYDEAVAQCRPEQVRMNAEPPYHRTYPTTVETLARPEEPMQCSGHGYANIPRPVPQMANPQNCYNAPLLQPVHPTEVRDGNPMQHHPLAPNVVGFPSAIRLTGSLGAISNRGLLSILQRDPDHERPHNVPGFYTNNINMHTSLHRTIPRISTAVDTTILDTAISGFSRADRSLHGEIRRSFHKPSETRLLADTGRSMPRNLNLASDHPPAPRDASNSNMHVGGAGVAGGAGAAAGGERGRARADEQPAAAPAPAPGGPGAGAGPAAAPGPAGADLKPLPPPKPLAKPSHPHPPPPPHTHAHAHAHGHAHAHAQPPDACVSPQTLPLTVDKPSCVCSYEGSSAPGAEDVDDYRSECENCKSASSSRWVLEEGWDGEEEDGTQTLQRRAPPPAPPPPATATLPQPVTKQARTIMGPPSNWENWFNTIPDSDTESEEE